MYAIDLVSTTLILGQMTTAILKQMTTIVQITNNTLFKNNFYSILINSITNFYSILIKI